MNLRRRATGLLLGRQIPTPSPSELRQHSCLVRARIQKGSAKGHDPLISALPRHSSIWPPACHRSHYATAAVRAAELTFGQPVHETHPHMLEAGEITPGITAQEYHDRRARLAQSLPDGAVALLASADVQWRSKAVFWPYRQDSDFLYLTGFQEPSAIAAIRKTGPALGDYAFHLFCREKDQAAELWDGPRSGLQAAHDVFNADEVVDFQDVNALGAALNALVVGASEVFLLDPIRGKCMPRSCHEGMKMTPLEVIREAVWPSPTSYSVKGSLRPRLHRMRAVKSPAEIALMRRAGQATGRALTEAMRRPWARERDLHAFLDHEFVRQGCEGGPAYVPVVAGGSRGRIVHYTSNTGVLEPGETVLVDAGGERGGYVADVSRTWPVSGRFDPAQRDLYEAVLAVQRTCVDMCRADARCSLDSINTAAERGLHEQLVRLGFPMPRGAIDVLFGHHVGHYIGLDVHDAYGWPRSVVLETGHCVAIEPAVYVPDDERWPRHFRGLAVRVEDSVCVQDRSPLVLSAEAVREVVDIEALRDV